MTDAFTFGKAMHEALLEGWPFSLTDMRPSGDATQHYELRGWRPDQDFPVDPDGLDDIDPMVERLLRPYQRDAIVVITSTGGRLAGWAQDLFDRSRVPLTETISADTWSTADANPIADIQRAIYARDKAALKMLADMRSDDPHMDAILSLRRLPMMDKRIFVEQDPEPAGRRYGPYDADPHTKGRRRRFRNQRRT